MRNLNYQLKQLCARNRDGSLGIRAKRQRPLNFESPRVFRRLVCLSQATMADSTSWR